MNKATVIKISAIILFIAICVWFNYGYLDLTPEKIRAAILSFGLVAPFIFIALHIVRPLILFPITVLSLTAGLAFDFALGSLLTLIGSVAGASLSFWVARKLGKGLRTSKDRGMLEKLEEEMATRGFIYVLFVRLLPFVPFDLVSYASGVSRIRFRAYLIATTVGAAPGCLIYSYIGSNLSEGNFWASAIAFSILIIVTVILLIYRKKMGWYA